MTKKQNPAQGQEQNQPFSVSLIHGTLSFESAADARKFIQCFSFHNRVVAQVLSDELQDPKSADPEKLASLGYLNRDIAELLCSIEFEIGEQA